jgi:hypothetical protein
LGTSWFPLGLQQVTQFIMDQLEKPDAEKALEERKKARAAPKPATQERIDPWSLEMVSHCHTFVVHNFLLLGRCSRISLT